MTSQPRVVAVTGSSGHMGAKLLEHLEETPGLGKLVAFDTRPLQSPIHNIAAFRRDVATSIRDELVRLRVTTLAHLAFAWRGGLNRREAAAMSERNAAMLRSVLRSCQQARVEHVVYLSSHTVYGARPDNSLPLNEASPLRPAPGFPYAQDNLRAEQALQEFAEENPDVSVTILRSCPALGATTDMEKLREFYFPGWVGLSDHNPPLQFVYEDDLARVLCLAITERFPGVFNVAGSGVAFLRELSGAVGARRLLLPASIAYPLKRLTGGSSVAHSHNLDRWPIIMSTSRLQRETGYRFRHTASQALTALTSYNQDLQDLPFRWHSTLRRTV